MLLRDGVSKESAGTQYYWFPPMGGTTLLRVDDFEFGEDI